ncbi:hypothetical protein B5K11_25700 [Rhizobium leguminosarum bv. trifolii]|uniref:MmcQ/YjbR family DNA-binding protein n=1 Tax=Rhizobium leguminosarum TaxID=384 RepID=UPI000E2EA878|nr:MmcQ/YjbR family DNA-binding protein [Rhizobium leguminosarum]RFB88841.1 hypothetical protein B5K11_25700 [Rhizobium leguminosarum bv. trifolii]
MDAKSLIVAAHKSAQRLHDAVVEPASASGRQVYKVGGRIFAIVSARPHGATVTVKADPVRGEILRQQYAEIVPDDHLNRRHWISISAGDGVTEELVDEEVRESYRLVRSTLPSNGRATDGSKQRRLTSRQVQPFARRLAASLPGVSHGRPFVEKLDVYKVRDKVFLIVTDDPNERIITVKVAPEQRDALSDRFQSVSAGRYLDKDHWISISAGPGITDGVVTDLVEGSYRLVLKTIRKADRPDGSEAI